jgi:hypothetical protein
VPRWLRRQAYNVSYVELGDGTGGQLWVTRHGWCHLTQLDPSRWFLDSQYDRLGQRLSGGTGAVFRVRSSGPDGKSVDLVVKFSRMAQEVLLRISSAFPADVPAQVVDNIVFNDPFQEFGVLEDMRNSRYGPATLRIRTKRPLAIYSPGQRFKPWQLGRTSDRFRTYVRQLEKDQDRRPEDMAAVEMSIDRQYIALFQWVRGDDTQTLVDRRVMTIGDAELLVRQIVHDLAAKGFHVPDTKPNHIILRTRRNGTLLTRAGKLVYALVDFELLQRTDAYLAWQATR